MKTMSSREVQKHFSAVVSLAESGELARKFAGLRLIAHLQSQPTVLAAEKLTQDDINRMMVECFAQTS